jgi:prolyl 4-hydroxylase
MSELEPLKADISLEELTAKAEAGHYVAQYTLSKVMAGRGENRKAAEWLTKAADNRFAPAQYELGMWHLLGHHVDANLERARALITDAAGRKFPEALRLRAVLDATSVFPEGSWESAVDHVLAAADLADPHALRQIGFLMRTRGGDKKLSDTMLKAAASLNEPICLQLVGAQKGVQAEKLIPENWKAWPGVRTFLLGLNDEAPRQGEALSEIPAVQKFAALLSPEECLYLREMARPSLTENVQLLGGNPKDPSYRELQTNRVMIFYPIVHDLTTVLLARRLMAQAGLPPGNAEMLIVQNTREGEEFKPHTDYLDPAEPHQAYSIQQAGQRAKSLFCYLNDGYEGGETAFPETGFKFKGCAGDAIVLENVNSIGLPEEKSRHAGLPVTKGEKWLASIWFRDKAVTA